MKKRACSVVLAILMAIGSVLPCAAAEDTKRDENILGKISIYSEYGEKTQWDAALHNGNLILMTPEDIGTIAGASDVDGDSSDDSWVISRGNYRIKIDTEKEEATISVALFRIEEGQVVVEPYGGAFPLEYVTEIEIKGEKKTFLPLEQMLYLLNVQWACVNGSVYTVSPKETLWNVAGSGIQSIRMGDLPRKEDIFGEGINKASKVVLYGVASCADELTVWSFLPGNDQRFLKRKMKEGLLRLSVPSSAYLGDQDMGSADSLGENLSDPADMLRSASTVTSGVSSGLELLQKFYDWLKPMAVDVNLDAGSWNVDATGILGVADPVLTSITKSMDIVMTASRHKSWDEEYVGELKYLTEFEDKANKELCRRVREAAGELYQEERDSDGNLLRGYLQAAKEVITDGAAGLTVTGKVLALYNAMVEVADTTSPAFAYSLDLGDAAALANSLTEISQLMGNQYSRELKELGKENLTLSKIRNIRHAGLLSIGSAAHVWAILKDPVLSDASSRTGGWEADRCFSIATRLSESVQYDRLLLLYKDYRDIHAEQPGAMRCMIPPEYVRYGVPRIDSSHIVEYNGTIYSISVRTDKRSLEDMGLVSLGIDCDREKYYICSFTIYKDKVYFICKEPGTSGYHSELYRCNVDGSEQTLLKELGENARGSFYIENGRLYAWTAEYLNLTTNQWENDSQYQMPDRKSSRYHSKYLFVSEEDGIFQTEYEQAADGSVHYGDTHCVVPIEYSRTEKELGFLAGIEAVTEEYVFYTMSRGGDGCLFRYNINTGENEELDSHEMVGGGGPYFNW